MEKYGLDKTARPVTADSLKKYIDAKHKAEGDKYQPLSFGMVHPVSTHNYELRYWMASAGIVPDSDCTIKPFPPPTMPSNLIAGNIEGYCVGEPWNSRIVLKGKGSALLPTMTFGTTILKKSFKPEPILLKRTQRPPKQ